MEVKNKNQELDYLMRRFGDHVLQLAVTYLRDYDEAEDVAQEVFLRVYTSLDKFRGNSSPFTWIYRITVNLCRDRLRRKSVIRWEQLAGDDLWRENVNPEQQALASLEEQALFQDILELPILSREVIVLHYLNQLSLKEIAEITGTSVTVIKVRLYRSRQKLKKLLEKRGVG